MHLQFLQHTEINKAKWDNCITNAANGRVYALSWYLDEMCPGWAAVATADYRFIMPLPVRIKWGLTYIFQPAFTQQLGIFSVDKCTEEVVTNFIEKIKKHFNYAELNFNSENKLGKTFDHSSKKNYLLSLDETFGNLQKEFNRSAKRNITKALQHNIQIVESDDCSILLALHKQRYGNSISNNSDLISLEDLLRIAATKGMAYFFYAKNAAGKYIASSCYLKFKERLIFLVNGNIEEGLEKGATHLLKNYAIEKFSNAKLIMDFEGSETPAFARFYEQYGAKSIDAYSYYKFNNLPVILKLFKK